MREVQLKAAHPGWRLNTGRMNKPALCVVAALMSLLLGACSSSGGGGHHPTSNSSTITASSASITISSFAYTGDLTVKAGAKVTVTNKDGVPHTLTDKATMKFDTGTISPNSSGTFTAPTKPGSYPFGCRFHPDMKGTLIVQ